MISSPCLAQEDEGSYEDDDIPESTSRPSALVGAVWCKVESSSSSSTVIEEDNTSDSGDTGIKNCDMGVGLSLKSYKLSPSLSGDRYLSWVVVVGGRTIGSGVAMTVTGTDNVRVSVSVGVVMDYDFDLGIDYDSLSPALGMTLGFK